MDMVIGHFDKQKQHQYSQSLIKAIFVNHYKPFIDWRFSDDSLGCDR
ncbi:hypothetical protein CZ794_05840 [Psychrobacter sp. JB385]|nr:hypothetical protein CZ794_05840 [Psychrobacter sp. JB385]